MDGSVMERTELATPPALSAGRNEEIRQALATFEDFNARNAADALDVLSKLDNIQDKNFADYKLGDARLSANKAENIAFNAIDGHKALGRGNGTARDKLTLYTPREEGSRDRDTHPYDKVANPLAVNPIEETLGNLQQSIQANAGQVAQLKAQNAKNMERHGRTYDNGELELAETSAARFAVIAQELESANLRYTAAFRPLADALKAKNITPDEIVRYNDELKEKVIADTLTDFTKTGAAGEKSKAQTAREALATFYEYADRNDAARNLLSRSIGNGIDDLSEMGKGNKANGGQFDRYSVGSASLALAAENMDRIIAQAKPDASRKLIDAKALFVGATRGMKEAFETHAIGADSLKRYNGKMAQAETRRNAGFEGQDTRDKIRQFAGDGSSLARYQAVVDGINALLAVKDKPDFKAGGEEGASAYIAKNQGFLNAMRDHVANKKKAVQAIADGRALTQGEYQSIVQHPVVDAEFGDRDHIPQYSLRYSDQPKRVGHGALTQTWLVASEISSKVKSHDPDVLAAQGELTRMKDAIFNGDKLSEVESKYGVTPENIRKLMQERKLEVAATPPAEEKPAATAESPILLADPSPRITGAKDGEIEALTGGFAAKASAGNRQELLRAREDLTPLKRRVDERLEADGKENQR